MDLDAVADELYSLPPEEFTATRNQREKEAKSEGDKELAADIRRLGKPNSAAALANQLVRERGAEVRPLLELGAGLREATATLSGQQLRELGKQQHQVVHALVQQARQLANAAGRKVSEDTARGLADTLHAALADEDAAHQLLAGRLTDVLRRNGFSPQTGSKPALRLVPPPAPARTAPRDADVARARADQEAAQGALEEATTARDRAQEGLDELETAVTDAASEVERLRAELDKVAGEQERLERERRQARTAVDKAERHLRDLDRRLEDATDRLHRLTH